MTAQGKRETRANFIATTKGGAGWFAVEMWWNPDMGGFWEPYQTGMGRYVSEAEAEAEGKRWAEAEGIEFTRSRQS